jgi:hypothetical protein
MIPKYDEDGQRLTDCCGCYSTYHDDVLCCKKCYAEVEHGQGDGSEYIDGRETGGPVTIDVRDLLAKAEVTK